MLGAGATLIVWLVGHFGFGIYEQLDVRVYQTGAAAILDSQPLYQVTEAISGLGFTYPPAAAIAFVPLAAVPFWLAGALVAAASCAALARICDISLRRLGHLPGVGETSQFWLLLAAAFLCDPVMSTLWFGQINLIIVWLVLEDLTRPDSRLGGIGSGLATALKLTPAAFLALLAVAGAWRRLAIGVGTAAMVTVLGWLVLPADSHDYWTHVVFDAPRMGGVAFQGNQSVTGVIARALADPRPPALLSVSLSVAVLLACLLLARTAIRCGPDADTLGWKRAIVITALGGLIAAPISWTHHWIWCIPAACLLGIEVAHGRPGARALLAVTAAVFLLRPVWWLSHAPDAALYFSWWQQVVAATDLLWAVAVLLWYAWWLIRRRNGRQAPPRFN